MLGGFFETREDCSRLINETGDFKTCVAPENVQTILAGEVEKSPLTIDFDYLYLDKIATLCPDGKIENCPSEANGEPIFYDRHHLSVGYARFMGRELAKKYTNELAALGLPVPKQE